MAARKFTFKLELQSRACRIPWSKTCPPAWPALERLAAWRPRLRGFMFGAARRNGGEAGMDEVESTVVEAPASDSTPLSAERSPGEK